MLVLNHQTARLPARRRPGPRAHAFHKRLPGYSPTPLRDLPGVAARLGVGRVLVKAETERLELPAFKILGASWATYRLMCERLGGEPTWHRLDDLARVVERDLGPLRLVTATDGNHGRAVARVARLLRMQAVVFVPTGTAPARIRGIESEGAVVEVVDGTYDDAVVAAARLASDRDLVVSDTSWPGYEKVPRWVIEGYSTIFAEIETQLAAEGVASVDLAVIPIGVGALAAAAGASLRAGLEPGVGPMLVGVEPDDAACVAAAIQAGHVVEVPGPHESVMAGLNCGLASVVALPTITSTFDAIVTVDDDRCHAAMRTFAENGLEVGETGAAALAGLAALVDVHRSELVVSETATVLIIATEGVTDPVGYESAVGFAPT